MQGRSGLPVRKKNASSGAPDAATMYSSDPGPVLRNDPTLSNSVSEVLSITDNSVVYPSLPTVHSPVEDTDLAVSDGQEQCESMSTRGFVGSLRRPSPNIARRRVHTPFLTRTLASPSHLTKMAQIFQDAQASLQADSMACTSPSGIFSSNTKRTRVSKLQLQRETVQDLETYLAASSDQSHDSPSPTRRIPNGISALFEAAIPQEPLSSSLYSPPRAVSSSELGHASLEVSETINSGFAMPGNPERHHSIHADSPPSGCAAQICTNATSAVDPQVRNSLSHGDNIEALLCSLPSIRTPLYGLAHRQSTSHHLRRAQTHGVNAWLEQIPDMSSANTAGVKRTRNLEQLKRIEGISTLRKQMSVRDTEVCSTSGDFFSEEHNTSSTKIAQRRRRDSNKENQSPPRISPVQETDLRTNVLYQNAEQPSYFPVTPQPPVWEHRISSMTPSRFRFVEHRHESFGAVTTKQPKTPHSLPTKLFPPKRLKGPNSPIVGTLPATSINPFVIAEDADDVVTLSPDVETYRKHNRPKRNRCASYYDEDIIASPAAKQAAEFPVEEGNPEAFIQKGREVLAESALDPELTAPKAFMEDGEERSFFGVRNDGD